VSNEVFPTLPGLEWGVMRTPNAPPVQKRSTPSRREFRARDAATVLYDYTLSYEFLRAAVAFSEWQTLTGFFERMGGSFDTFLFTDPDDNTVSAMQFGTGTGAQTQFQLVRTLGGAAGPVFDLNGTPQIFNNGVLQSTPANYSINSAGLVTFTAAPANGNPLTWTGSFYRRVRFARDQLEFRKFMQDFWDARKVELTQRPA